MIRALPVLLIIFFTSSAPPGRAGPGPLRAGALGWPSTPARSTPRSCGRGSPPSGADSTRRRALASAYVQTMRYVVLPQALRASCPPGGPDHHPGQGHLAGRRDRGAGADPPGPDHLPGGVQPPVAVRRSPTFFNYTLSRLSRRWSWRPRRRRGAAGAEKGSRRTLESRRVGTERRVARTRRRPCFHASGRSLPFVMEDAPRRDATRTRSDARAVPCLWGPALQGTGAGDARRVDGSLRRRRHCLACAHRRTTAEEARPRSWAGTSPCAGGAGGAGAGPGAPAPPHSGRRVRVSPRGW